MWRHVRCITELPLKCDIMCLITYMFIIKSCPHLNCHFLMNKLSLPMAVDCSWTLRTASSCRFESLGRLRRNCQQWRIRWRPFCPAHATVVRIRTADSLTSAHCGASMSYWEQWRTRSQGCLPDLCVLISWTGLCFRFGVCDCWLGVVRDQGALLFPCFDLVTHGRSSFAATVSWGWAR